MNFRKLAAVTAAVGMSVLVSVNAKAATVEEVLQVAGDIWAITRLCPQREPARDTFAKYVADNGMSTEQFNEGGVYAQDLIVAHLSAVKARKTKTMKDNCADAEKLYGEKGSVAQMKWVDAPQQPTGK